MMKERKLLALLGTVLFAGCGGLQKTEPTVEITTDADGAAPDTGPLVIPDAGSRVPGHFLRS